MVYRFHLQIDTQLIVPYVYHGQWCRTRTGNLADADKWKIAFAILVKSTENQHIQILYNISFKYCIILLRKAFLGKDPKSFITRDTVNRS